MPICIYDATSNNGMTLSGRNASESGTALVGARADYGNLTGRWYFEFKVIADGTGHAEDIYLGITPHVTPNSVLRFGGPSSYPFYWRGVTGQVFIDNGEVTTGPTRVPYAINDIIGYAVDLDAMQMWASKNGVWILSGDPDNLSTPVGTWTAAPGQILYPMHLSDNITSALCESELRANVEFLASSPPNNFDVWAPSDPELMGQAVM